MKLANSVLVALCAAMSVHANLITCQEKQSVTCEYYNDIMCCENSGCDDDGTPKCTTGVCCREKPEADEYYCEAKMYDCDYKDRYAECCEEQEGCDDDDRSKPVCSEDFCCNDKKEDDEYDLTCASVEEVDPSKRCNNGKDVIEDKECCRYTDRCSEGYEQMKCLHSFCCEQSEGNDNTCEDIYDCDYKDKDKDCGDNDEECTLEACCNDTDPDGEYDVFCDEDVLDESDPDTSECRDSDEVVINERKCCRYSNRCSRNWVQDKCLYSNCCGKDDEERPDPEGSVISCDKYFDDGAECDGERQDGSCKDREETTTPCSEVCCKKAEPPKDCPPITLQACVPDYGRILDEDGCETSTCKGVNDKTCMEEVECDKYAERDCCENTNKCTEGYAQSKCLSSWCCA